MIIERNRIYKMDCIEGIKEMLQGGKSRLYHNRPAIPNQLQIQPQAKQRP